MPEKQVSETSGAVAKKKRRSGSEKRQNTKRVTFRVSDAQDAELEKNARALNVSVGGFIRLRCCSGQEIKPRKLIPVEVQAVLQLRGQLGKLGGNLNQIVRRENFNENPYAHEYREALAGVRETIAECHALLREAQKRSAA